MMGKSDTLRFEFDSGQYVYFPGQKVNGRLIVNFENATKVREIRLTFDGSAVCRWEEGSSNNRTVYVGKEDYFHLTAVVFGKGMGMGEENTLPQGEHMFPFSFQFPYGIPSSLEHRAGYIRYSVEGRVDKPRSFDQTATVIITVVAALDLNVIPNVMTPIYSRQEKFLCCCCCRSGPITAMLRINRTGFVPGQAIPFEAEIQNLSKRTCKVAVKLMMHTTFTVRGHSRTAYNEMARVTHPDVPRGETEVWSGDQLVLPPLTPSFNPCKIVDVDYTLQLVIDPTGPGKNLVVPIGIIIGTVPLHEDTLQQQQQQQTQSPLPSSIARPDQALSPPQDPNEIISMLALMHLEQNAQTHHQQTAEEN